METIRSTSFCGNKPRYNWPPVKRHNYPQKLVMYIGIISNLSLKIPHYDHIKGWSSLSHFIAAELIAVDLFKRSKPSVPVFYSLWFKN